MKELIGLNQDLETLILSSKNLHKTDTILNFREQFYIPKVEEKVTIYFCGHSLGLQPKSVQLFVNEELEAWKNFGVDAHFFSRTPWYTYHRILTPALMKLTGSLQSEVVAMNALTVNIHLLLASFYRPSKKRFKILIDSPTFSSDYYAITSQIEYHNLSIDDTLLEVKPRQGADIITNADVFELIDKNKDELALIWVSGVNYYSGQLMDMKMITEYAHRAGALVGFDLAHSIGNTLLNLHDWNVDFASWCSYKYLNSGPGGVSGVFIHERFHKDSRFPAYKGWWGVDEQVRFSMKKEFIPQNGAEAWQLSNAPILLMAAHKASLDIFEAAGIENLSAKSILMSKVLFSGIKLVIKEYPETGIRILTPDNPEERGCQISIYLEKDGKVLFDFLKLNGILTDWREPNVIRLAPVPLYNTFEEIATFLQVLEDFFKNKI